MEKITEKTTVSFELKTLGCVSFFLICWGFAIVLVYHTSDNLLDGAASSELLLANLLSKENRILSSNWFYSTELRVLNTQLVFAPLFKIFTSWRMVRFVGDVILQAILLLSYGFFAKKARFSLDIFLLTAPFLVLPQSIAYARIVLAHTYYIPHISIGFILIGLFFDIVHPEHTSRVHRNIYFILFIALNVVSGLGGVRQPMITQFPLFVISAFFAILSLYPSRLNSGEPTNAMPNTFFKTQYGRAVVISFIGLICGGVGYIINSQILMRIYSFTDFGKLEIGNLNFYLLKDFAGDIFSLFGFKPGGFIISLFGIASLLRVCCCIFFIVYSILSIKKLDTSMDISFNVISIFFIVSLVISAFIYFFVGSYSKIYYIPVFVYIAPLTALLFERCKRQLWLKYLPLFLVLLYAINGAITINTMVTDFENSSLVYDGLCHEDPHTIAKIAGAVHFLDTEGYTFGYSTFWYANTLTEMSDGRIECACIEFPDYRYRDWLTIKAYCDPDHHQGKAFILASYKEYEGNDFSPLTDGQDPVYQDEYFVVYSYPDIHIIHQYLTRE